MFQATWVSTVRPHGSIAVSTKSIRVLRPCACHSRCRANRVRNGRFYRGSTVGLRVRSRISSHFWPRSIPSGALPAGRLDAHKNGNLFLTGPLERPSPDVSETAQPSQLCRTESLRGVLIRRQLARLGVAQPAGQLRCESLDDVGVIGRDVVVVERVVGVVVQLEFRHPIRRVDVAYQLPSVRDHRVLVDVVVGALRLLGIRFRSLNAGRSIHPSEVGSAGLTTSGSRLWPWAVSGTGIPASSSSVGIKLSDSTVGSTTMPAGSTPGQRSSSGTLTLSPYTVLPCQAPAVVHELFAVVADEPKQRVARDAALLEPFHQAGDFGVQASDRAVIPVQLVRVVDIGIDPRRRQLLPIGEPLWPEPVPVGHPPIVAQRLANLLESRFMLLLAGRRSPQQVVGRIRLERVVRVEGMDEGEERHIVVVVEPGQEPVDIGTRCLGAAVTEVAVVDRRPFVQHLDTLVHIAEVCPVNETDEVAKVA